MFTLNNIDALFLEFAQNHYNLGNNKSDYRKHYYFGVAGEHEGKNGGVKYPLLIAELQNSGIATKMDGYSFKMWVMTQHKLYEGRDVEMLSDMKQIAGDFVIWLRQTKFIANVTFTIDENVIMTDFHQSFNDGCCGWYFTINVKQFLDWDLCRIPMTGAPGPDPSGGVKIFDQNGNLLFTKYPGQMLIVNDFDFADEVYTISGLTQSIANTPGILLGVYLEGQSLTSGQRYTISGTTITFDQDYSGMSVNIKYLY